MNPRRITVMAPATLATDRPARRARPARAVWPVPAPPRRAALVASVMLAAAAAWFAGAAMAPAGAAAIDPDLARLLRLMALLKLAMAAGATVLVYWRLGHPASRMLASLSIAATAAMAAAAPLIWHLGTILPGAALFHAGLLGLLGLASTDGTPLPPSWRRAGPVAAPAPSERDRGDG